MRKSKYINLLLCLFVSTMSYAQNDACLTDGLSLEIEASATVGDGDFAPMWLYSNRHGIVSPYANSAYERIMLNRSVEADSVRKWRRGYNVDLTVNQHSLSTFMIHQAYAEVGYGKGLLTIGQKEYEMPMYNALLSSGAQTLGINAMPIPQVRLALDDYWTIPYTRKWLGIKGHIAYGIYTDGSWQKQFTHDKSKYLENQLYHSKAGYLKIQKPGSPLSVNLGIEMVTQFGGNAHFNRGGEMVVVEHPKGFTSFWHAFVPGGGDEGEGLYANCEGNTLGTWLVGVDYEACQSTFKVYAEKFFEDHSAMFFLDYDGYGSGADWNKKVGKHWIVYDMKDVLLGLEWKRHQPWYIDNVVGEFVATKYQSGPINHDRTPDLSDHIAGRDNFYNNSNYSGWHNWGLVSGNPFYLSPIYNADGQLVVDGNRYIAYHLGIGGTISDRFTYRLLSSWQRCWGSYYNVYPDPKENYSFMTELHYSDFKAFGLKGWNVKGAFGLDHGALRGNNIGAQLTISKHFSL